jgi:2,4-dienoyl-CoA reductase (NADPH2)
VPKRRIVVAGAGPGGMEAARIAATLGHEVVVFEREEAVGGQLRRAARAPFRSGLTGFAGYLEADLARLGVEVRRGTEATAESVRAEEPDLVIVATGSVAEPATAGASDSVQVLSIWELLDGQRRDLGRSVLLVDDGTGFWPGAGAADFLVGQRVELTFATPAAAIGSALPLESIHLLHRRLRSAGTAYRPFTRLAGIDGDVIRLQDTMSDQESELRADTVVLVTGQRAVNGLVAELGGHELNVAVIGDAVSPRRITHAVLDANKLVRGYKPVGASRPRVAQPA